MLGFVQKPFFLELEFILSKIFVPLVRDFQMFQKLTNRLPFCFVLRHPHSMRTFATFISVGIARIADRGSWIADRGSRIADRGSRIAFRDRGPRVENSDTEGFFLNTHYVRETVLFGI